MNILPSKMGMWVAKLFSGSKSVENEVLRRLPEKIKFEFRAEFDNDNQLVIFAAAPEHEGLFSEGKDFDETINNCCDAVLTYFDVPREYAKLVEYECVGEDQQSSMPEELEKESWLKRVVLNKHLACA